MASELHVDAIKHSGGTSALTIDSSGHVSHPVRPYFSVRQNDGQSLASGTQTTMLHATSISQRGNDYDSSTGFFTAPVTGLYNFNADVQISSATQWQFFLQHSNSGGSGIRGYVGFNGASGEKTTIASQSLTIQMTAGELMMVRVTHFLGSNQNIFGHFQGYFIG
tara:strand:+ start:507 stop:1001 length:495 start_codon:yes stop_codon:yes gene_type:complete